MFKDTALLAQAYRNFSDKREVSDDVATLEPLWVQGVTEPKYNSFVVNGRNISSPDLATKFAQIGRAHV